MMAFLAGVAGGNCDLSGDEDETILRQIGYSATLARGRIEDPEDRLGRLVRTCRDRLADSPAPDGTYRDPVQARWGAAWHLDAGKLKVELPLHLARQRRKMDAMDAPAP